MVNRKILAIIGIAVYFTTAANAQVYKNPKARVQQRLADLLKRTTLEEKVGQMSMSSLGEAKNSKFDMAF